MPIFRAERPSVFSVFCCQVFAEKNKVKEEFELLNGERDEEMKMVKPLKDRVDEVKSQIQKVKNKKTE